MYTIVISDRIWSISGVIHRHGSILKGVQGPVRTPNDDQIFIFVTSFELWFSAINTQEMKCKLGTDDSSYPWSKFRSIHSFPPATGTISIICAEGWMQTFSNRVDKGVNFNTTSQRLSGSLWSAGLVVCSGRVKTMRWGGEVHFPTTVWMRIVESVKEKYICVKKLQHLNHFLIEVATLNILASVHLRQ